MFEKALYSMGLLQTLEQEEEWFYEENGSKITMSASRMSETHSKLHNLREEFTFS